MSNTVKSFGLPLRKCIGCGIQRPKQELVRIVHTLEGDVQADPTHRANGRGAYLCWNKECLARAMKNGGLNRSFKMTVPRESLASLEESLRSLYGEG